MARRFSAVSPLPSAGVLLAAVTLAASCSPSVPDGGIASCEQSLSLPAAVSTDILFVIDDSGSMREEQDKVIAQLEAFVTALANAPVKNDFQIGVVTTSVTEYAQSCSGSAGLTRFDAESGRLQRGRLAPTGPKLLRSADSQAQGATWIAQVKQLIDQGTQGSGQEMGLEAARRAVSEPLISAPLDAQPAGNAGFLRPGSRLLVVIVSDEDDCSVPAPEALAIEGVCGGSCQKDSDCGGAGNYCVLDQQSGGRRCARNACETAEGRARLVPVQQYVDFFRTLDDGTGLGRTREVFLAVIGAVDASGEPARCRSATDEAYGVARRYRAAVDGMGESGLVTSICSADYGESLQRIAELVGAPQTLQLSERPADPKLMVIEVARDGGTILCRVGSGFDYDPGSDGAPARVTMIGECRLQAGDRIDVKLACVG